VRVGPTHVGSAGGGGYGCSGSASVVAVARLGWAGLKREEEEGICFESWSLFPHGKIQEKNRNHFFNRGLSEKNISSCRHKK
jgi:hypothetical protein